MLANTSKLITLPSAEEMLARLTRVYDAPGLVMGLYPALQKHAGSSKNAFSLLMIFESAIADFMTETERVDPVIANILDTMKLDMIAAVIDDPGVIEGVKEVLEMLSKP